MNRKTLADLSEDYLAHRRSLNYSSHTVKNDFKNIKGFRLWLEEGQQVYTADRLRKIHLQAWQQHLVAWRTRKGHPLDPKSINRRIEGVRGFLKYLVRHSYVQVILLESFEYLKEPKCLPRSVLTHQQVKKLVARIDTSTPGGYRNRAMLELLYSSGLRVSELLGLNIGDLNFKHGTAMVLGKGGKERVVPVGRTALKCLESYLIAVRPYLIRNPSEIAFFLSDRSGKRMPYTTLLHQIHRYADKEGIDIVVTPHTFRRSCTTELIRAGANLYHTKELLGHETLETLQHYVKLTITDLKKTHEKCHPREKDR